MITVDGVVNLAPVVEAGANQAITLPTNAASLSGTATDDGCRRGSLTTAWSKVSGPGTVTFANAAALGDDRDVLDAGHLRAAADGDDGLLSGERHRDRHGQCEPGEQGASTSAARTRS